MTVVLILSLLILANYIFLYLFSDRPLYDCFTTKYQTFTDNSSFTQDFYSQVYKKVDFWAECHSYSLYNVLSLRPRHENMVTDWDSYECKKVRNGIQNMTTAAMSGQIPSLGP